MATDYTTVATQLIENELGHSGASSMPTELYDWTIAQVAKRLGEIDKLANGVVQYGPDGETSFLSSDPLKPVRTVLNRFKGLGAVG